MATTSNYVYNWTIEDTALEGRVDSLKEANETDNSFARRCGLDSGNITKFRRHKISFGATYLRRIAAACGVSYAWLKDGIGDRNDPEGMITETTPDKNRSYANIQEDNTADAITIDILKAENDALHKALQNMNNMMDILQKTLDQNNRVLAQNAEALSHNRALMKFISDIVNNK